MTGIDFSARFIRIALELKEKGSVHFELVEEGDVVSYHEARLADIDLEGVAGRVEFFQGDATNLKPQFSGYDLVLAANLLDRLYDPRRFLETIHERIVPGGLLVLTSPYTWQEESTCKEHWLGGFRQAGEPRMTLDALRELLAPQFVMLRRPAGRGVCDSRNAAEVPAHGCRVDGLAAAVVWKCTTLFVYVQITTFCAGLTHNENSITRKAMRANDLPRWDGKSPSDTCPRQKASAGRKSSS